MIAASSSLTDVAFAVCTALDRGGVTAVMTGGSAATFYAPDAYQSSDIDFVITMHAPRGAEVLARLGYTRKNDYYVHPDSPFPLEFPPGPLMVGDERISGWQTVRRADEVLHVLSAMDACRDRLAGYLFWNDFSALEQSLAVYTRRSREIDLEAVRDWCRREKQLEKFELFRARLG